MATMATQAELEAAIAALAGKKRRLREAFDRLVACSPVPVPFRWEDLDAHLASIAAASFCHLDSTQAGAIAGAAAAGGPSPTTAAHHVQHPDKAERVGRGACEEGQGGNAEEGEGGGNAPLQQERGKEGGEVREASSARPDRESDEAGNIVAVEAVPIVAVPEQLDDDREEKDAMGAIVASPHQRDDDIEMTEEVDEEVVVEEEVVEEEVEEEEEEVEEEVEVVVEEEVEEEEEEEQEQEEKEEVVVEEEVEEEEEEQEQEEKEEVVVVVEEEEAENASADRECNDDEAEEGEWQHPHDAAGGGGETSALARAVAAACAGMDPSTLVDALRLGGRRSLDEFLLPALLGAPDPHALLVGAVGGFLDLASASAGPREDASEWWANCIALIECAPRLAAPSPGALAQAKHLIGRWKEMAVVGPAGAGGGMAGWGLLAFIASYNIVPELDGDEIIRLFGDVAPEVKDKCVELCKRLGLIGKMTDSINHFIETGQPLDAIRLARTFSLTDKFPPVTIMNDYVENAKKAAEDILSKESYTLESLNQAMAKKVDALIFSWSAIDGYDIDSVQRKSIKEEITLLLHKYANKQQSLAGVSSSISSSQQQQNFQEEYHQRPQVRLLEHHQQQKPNERQQKLEEKQHQQKKAQETQHEHIQNQQEPQKREMWQNRKRKRLNKNRKRKQRRQNLQQQNKRPRLLPYVRPGISNQHWEPFSEFRRAPFAAYSTTIPRYFWYR